MVDSDTSPAPWRSGYAAVCKTVYTGSNPVGASIALRTRSTANTAVKLWSFDFSG